MSTTHPPYQAIVDAAVTATDASSGWLLSPEGNGLRVMAVAGISRAQVEPGSVVQTEGARAFVLASGQPAALMPQPSDVANRFAGASPGIPASLLAIPCGDSDVLGVLEVASKADGAGFGFGDIEVLSGLAQVAAAILEQRDDSGVDIASPAQISAEIHALAQRSPSRYANLVTVIEALLSIE